MADPLTVGDLLGLPRQGQEGDIPFDQVVDRWKGVEVWQAPTQYRLSFEDWTLTVTRRQVGAFGDWVNLILARAGQREALSVPLPILEALSRLDVGGLQRITAGQEED